MLNPQERAQIDEIVEQAFRVHPAEREDLLSRICAKKPALRSEIESRLELREATDAHGLSQRLTTDVSWPSDLGRGVDPPNPIPDRVGSYRILDRIGRGGMGDVYLAEQREPIRRRVAIKLVKTGLDSREVLARFEAERNALAMMDHPHIARVHEAAATEDGVPYFTMEYVQGQPITEYCNLHRANVTERLELFSQVCEGVEHAHHRGVVHRDLKPSNILVTTVDEKPMAKIIDFGIARATNQRLTEKTLYTEAGRIIGTPAYMSPEQARSAGEGVDHRADVYSLGVLLYELLVGRLPLEFDVKSLALEELLRRVREDEPASPSTVLDRLNPESRQALADDRKTHPKTLEHELRIDLDWICLRALEKEPDRRYPSPLALKEDISRYLRGESVEAGPPSVLYRTRKLLKRHRVAVAAAAAVLAALTIGLITSLFFALAAQRSADESWRNEQSALKHAQDAERERDAVLRLSDLKNLEDYELEAATLWPAESTKVYDLKAWLAKAAKLTENLPTHRATLEALRSRAVPGEPRDASAQFRTDEEAWWNRTLEELISSLEAFSAEDGTIESVRERLAFAATVRERTIEDFVDEWAAARRSIADRELCPFYDGLDLPPQEGLIPLGQDPDSRLWEFAHLQSGIPPRRGADGRLELEDETSIVLVLLPGGRFHMGAERASLGVRFTPPEDELWIEAVAESSLGMRLGLMPGDRLLALNGKELASKASLEAILAPLAAGARLALRMLRGGEERLVEGALGPNIDPAARSNEHPIHELGLSPFFLSKYEMTQGQWERFTGENPSAFSPTHELVESLLHPVETVSWDACDRVLYQLGLALPTEAQLEYATRAGTTTVWWTGNDRESLIGRINVADQAAARARAPWSSIADWPELDDGYPVHAPVGTFSPNPFGLHEVHGNAWEWCRDRFGDFERLAAPGDGLRHAGEGRVYRGGSYYNTSRHARSSNRQRHNSSTIRNDNLGCRPAWMIRS